jgi:acetylglutamate kinase
MTRADYDKYVASGIIQGGMIPKLDNAFDAIEKGVKEVIITSANAIAGNGGTHISK